MSGTVCIITARGGSKPIPRKNIRDFLGKPIMAYSIEAALKSGVFDEVMVSTDDEEIAAVAREYGAQVPFMRSAATANDYATTKDVLLEVLDEYEKRGRSFEMICCVYPTAPFGTEEKLKAAYNILKDSDADELLPVIPFSFPPQRAFVIRSGSLVFQYPEYQFTRSQDLEPIYHDCGQFTFSGRMFTGGDRRGQASGCPWSCPRRRPRTSTITPTGSWPRSSTENSS